MAALANSPNQGEQMRTVRLECDDIEDLLEQLDITGRAKKLTKKKITESQDMLYSKKRKECEDKYAHNHGFNIIETDEDGNCFYHSLQIFGHTTGHASLDKPSRQILRKTLIDVILADFDKQTSNIEQNAKNFALNKNELKQQMMQRHKYISSGITRKNIEQLLKSCVYRGNGGDLPPAFASDVFGIHLIVHSFNYDAKTVTIIHYKCKDPKAPTLDLLHSGEHYRLLWRPTDGPIKFPSKSLVKPNRTRKGRAKSAANANSGSNTRSRSKSGSPTKNNNNNKSPNKKITVRGKFQVKSKYAYLLDMTVPQLEGFIRDTFSDSNLPKMTKQNYLNYISETLNSM
jgi:hypothetical protein